MSYEEILYDVIAHVATITLNCPERMNSFSDTLLTEWADAITKSAHDEAVRAVIITGTGRAFCSRCPASSRRCAWRPTPSSHGRRQGRPLHEPLPGRPAPEQKAREGKVLRTDATAAERRNGLRFTVHQVARALHLLDKPYIGAIPARR